MNVNLKLLQTFLLVAHHRSFRKAAEESNRTASAVSMQVKQLEEQTGVLLLKRTSRSVELTPEGHLLLSKTRHALQGVDEGLAEIRAAALARNGLVTVASSPSIASTLLPQVLVQFSIENPSVTVRVRELGSQEILQAVSHHHVDFGIGPTVANASDFVFEPLLQDELCVLAPVEHAFSQRSRITLAQLHGIPLVMLASFAAMRLDFASAATAEGIQLNVQFEVQQMQTLVAMVAAGLAVGIAPRISSGIASPHAVKILGLASDRSAREISVITTRGTSPSMLALRLMAQLKTLAKHR